MMKKGARALLVVVLSVTLSAAPMSARAGTWTGGATEWTQISNNIQLIQHGITLISQAMALWQQVKYWKQTLETFKSPQDAMAILNGFQGILATLQGILFAGESLAVRWRQTHPGAELPEAKGYTDDQAYKRIDQGVNRAVERALEVLDAQGNSVDGWPKDRTIFANLEAKMGTVNGQMQAAQVANELLLEIIRQLHLLRQVQMAHASMMGEFASAESQRRLYRERIIERDHGYTGRFRATAPVDWSQAK